MAHPVAKEPGQGFPVEKGACNHHESHQMAGSVCRGATYHIQRKLGPELKGVAFRQSSSFARNATLKSYPIFAPMALLVPRSTIPPFHRFYPPLLTSQRSYSSTTQLSKTRTALRSTDSIELISVQHLTNHVRLSAQLTTLSDTITAVSILETPGTSKQCLNSKRSPQLQKSQHKPASPPLPSLMDMHLYRCRYFCIWRNSNP